MLRMYSINKRIRMQMQQKHIAIWEIADTIGVSEMTINRWLRKELDDDHRILVEKAIDRIVAERGECDE